MTTPILGILVDGEQLEIDLARLVETRLLITATSGAGKSWAIRRILEQTHSRGVQHLVIDPEGEFHTLREKFDYILFGRNGDYPLNVETARELAKRLRELRISAVLDVSEMKPEERIGFVRQFVEALMEVRQEHWHPALLVVDEAQFFAPESGSADSLAAVRDLSMRGRKRGLCPIFATQRPAALSKDCAASCGNKLVGRTVLDNDVRRAGEDLGFDKKQSAQLRDLENGSFFAVGPALSRTVTLVKVGSVETTHPKIGQHPTTAAPPQATVRKALETLKDMQVAASEEKSELERLRAENERLKSRPASGIDPEQIERARKAGYYAGLSWARSHYDRVISEIELAHRRVLGWSQQIAAETGRLADETERWPRETEAANAETTNSISETSVVRENRTTESAPQIREKSGDRHPQTVSSNGKLGKCEMALLAAMAFYHGKPISKGRISLISGYSKSSSSFSNALSTLRGHEFILGSGDEISITDAGLKALGTNYKKPPRGKALADYWLSRLDRAPSLILQVLIDHRHRAIDKQILSDRSGYSVTSSSFSNALSELRTLGMLSKGELRLHPEFAQEIT